MSEHESFLKMIGLDESAEADSSDFAHSEAIEDSIAAENTWEENDGFENSEEIIEEPVDQLNAHDLSSSFRSLTQEDTLKEKDYSFLEQKTNEELYQTEIDSPVVENEVVEDEVWGESENWDAAEDDLTDEPTRPTDEIENSKTEISRNTAVYADEEIKEFTQKIQSNLSKEDRLLEGLEEAEESRATDVFAQSFRSDSRKTHAADLEAQDEPSEIPELQTGEWEASTSVSIREERSTNPSRQTLAFSYESPKSSRLILIEGPADTSEISLNLLPISFGRDPKNNVVLDDSNVSRFHAEIRDVEGQICLVDLGSTNGVKVNGALVSEHKLQDHDVVQMGDSLFEFLLEGSQQKGAEAVRETFVSQTRSPVRKISFSKQKQMRLVAAGIFVFAGILFAYQKREAIFGGLAEKGQQVALSKAGQALEDFKSELEIQYDQPVASLSDSQIQEGFLEKLETYPFLPESLKAQLRQLPPALLRIFLDDPQILTAYVESGGNLESMKSAIREKLAHYTRSGKFEDAYSLIQILLQADPQNEELLTLKEDISKKIKLVETPTDEEVSEEDRAKFFSYMENFQKQTEELIEQGELEAARSFAQTVKEKTLELIRKQPAFGTFGESAVAEWSSKIAYLDQKIAERGERKEQVGQMIYEGDDRIDAIKRDMDAGRVYEAALAVEEFLRDYPDHPRADEVKQFGKEIEQAVQISFQSMNSKIETYVKTENYKVAWESLYRFLDLMPGYAPALSLREDLIESTSMRAVQYYNQARVFEFEADDLIAAEQYYKRVLETADPRGELAKKAERRYSDVMRKTIQ